MFYHKVISSSNTAKHSLTIKVEVHYSTTS